MNEYIEKFIEYIRFQRNYSNNTEINYSIDLEEFNNYLNEHEIKFKDISYREISFYRKYLKEERKLEPSSINRHLSALRSFYNYLLNQEVINSNPFKLISGPKKSINLPNYMKYSEFETMIETCDETPLGIRNIAILELLLATGARIGELIEIKLNDINFNEREIKVLGKGNKERICYFNEHALVSLKRYIEESRSKLLKNKTSDYLFINHVGNHLTDRGVRTIIDAIIKKSSLNAKITPHTFRHTFATMLLNAGCDLKSVQELLGHVNLSTTSIYTHVTNDRIRDIYLHTHPRSKK